MESLPGYDNWKLAGASPEVVECDRCGQTILLDDAQEYHGVYVCLECLGELEADSEELEEE
jgi:formylmethanofuran dehydrogenase subunit E